MVYSTSRIDYLSNKKKDKEPKTAKTSGICALISTILSFIIIIIVFSLTANIFNIISETIDKTNNNNYYTDDNNFNNNNNNNDNNDNNNFNNNNNNNDNNDNNDNNNELIIDDDNNTENSTTTNWKNYEITVNNLKISLPTTYEILSNATGFTFKSSDLKSYIESNHYTSINMYKNNNLALYIEVLNNKNQDSLYTDCEITRISQTKSQVSKGADQIIFPGNLKAGEKINEKKIIKLFGTPNDIKEYNYDNYKSKTYSYIENDIWTTTNNYKITVINDIIDNLQLDNRK